MGLLLFFILAMIFGCNGKLRALGLLIIALPFILPIKIVQYFLNK